LFASGLEDIREQKEEGEEDSKKTKG